jgi:hypothetical protein
MLTALRRTPIPAVIIGWSLFAYGPSIIDVKGDRFFFSYGGLCPSETLGFDELPARHVKRRILAALLGVAGQRQYAFTLTSLIHRLQKFERDKLSSMLFRNRE